MTTTRLLFKTVRTTLANVLVFNRDDRDEFRYAALTTIWIRWLALTGCLIEVNYRIDYGALSQYLNILYILGMMSANGYVHRLILTRSEINPKWMLAISVMDAATVSFSISLSGGFDSRYFVLYYFTAAVFSWAFPSPHISMLWTTMVAIIYTVICFVVGSGLDLGSHEEKVLFYRLLTLYGVATSATLIATFQRRLLREAVERELGAVAREQELNRQRIELSHSIHDTTAQSAYMIGMGVESALEVADKSNRELTDRLEGLGEMSRSVMWELRHPIDGGRIFSDTSLTEVLREHAETFTLITSVHAEVIEYGEEPPLSIIERSLLFSIAHNAMTNALRHAEPLCVTITLDFGSEPLCMSVSDDGLGLPEGYIQRGHGFRNMSAAAERMGGRLKVDSDDNGTVVSCIVPYDSAQGGA